MQQGYLNFGMKKLASQNNKADCSQLLMRGKNFVYIPIILYRWRNLVTKCHLIQIKIPSLITFD